MVIADPGGQVLPDRHHGSSALAEPPAVEVRRVSRRYRSQLALDRVSLGAGRGEVHALLGPNGAGKTTLLRILAGLVDADEGEVRFQGVPATSLSQRAARQQVGMVPSGDRSFYLRLSGLENLVFFGRLHGLRRSDAVARAWECLDAVGLADAGRKWVGLYSHGMQKRLSVARALLMNPPVLLVDEATHDLDPEGARRVRDLVARAAALGAGVIWATQRIDEIRGFAHRVTLLHLGRVRFNGSVAEFLGLSTTRHYVVKLDSPAGVVDVGDMAVGALRELAAIQPTPDPTQYVVVLGDGVTVGAMITALTGAGIDVLACREQQSDVEQVFVELTREGM